MRAQDLVAANLRQTGKMLAMFVEDFSSADWLYRTSAKANCAAWIVGHLALTDRRFAALAGVAAETLPKLPDGFEARFARNDEAAFAAAFGNTAEILPVFVAGRELLAAAVERVADAELDKPRDKGPMGSKNVGEMLGFASAHTAMHAGQITMIRRALGRPPLV